MQPKVHVSKRYFLAYRKESGCVMKTTIPALFFSNYVFCSYITSLGLENSFPHQQFGKIRANILSIIFNKNYCRGYQKNTYLNIDVLIFYYQSTSVYLRSTSKIRTIEFSSFNFIPSIIQKIIEIK